LRAIIAHSVPDANLTWRTWCLQITPARLAQTRTWVASEWMLAGVMRALPPQSSQVFCRNGNGIRWPVARHVGQTVKVGVFATITGPEAKIASAVRELTDHTVPLPPAKSAKAG